jgi:hypothetical protein
MVVVSDTISVPSVTSKATPTISGTPMVIVPRWWRHPGVGDDHHDDHIWTRCYARKLDLYIHSTFHNIHGNHCTEPVPTKGIAGYGILDTINAVTSPAIENFWAVLGYIEGDDKQFPAIRSSRTLPPCPVTTVSIHTCLRGCSQNPCRVIPRAHRRTQALHMRLPARCTAPTSQRQFFAQLPQWRSRALTRAIIWSPLTSCSIAWFLKRLCCCS